MQVKQSDIKGDIEGFPIHIVQAMVDEQIRQGNKGDVGVFCNLRHEGADKGGFDWEKTPQGHRYWDDIIYYRMFDKFKPTQSIQLPQGTIIVELTETFGSNAKQVVQQIINAIRATTDTLNLSQTDRHKVISDLNEWERVKRDLK